MDSFEANLVTDLAEDIQADPGFYDNPGIPYSSSRDDLFSLAVVNVLSAQARWDTAKRTVRFMNANQVLASGSTHDVLEAMKKAKYSSRNNNLKAKWIVENQQRFMDQSHQSFRKPFDVLIQEIALKVASPQERRNRLMDEYKGFGWKVASHFIRGLGLDGDQLAVLDTHLIRALKSWPALNLANLDLDEGMSKKKYLATESRLLEACRRLKIRLNDGDRFYWRAGSSSAT